MTKIRKHYILHGAVQGVGLRYRAYYLAREMGVTGYIRNLDDGCVEMEAEADRETLKGFLDVLGEGRFVEIESIEESTIPVQDDRTFERD